MRGNNEHRRSCLEAYAAFNANDCVAHVHVATDSVRSGYGLNLLNGLHLVGERLSIDGRYLAFLKAYLNGLRACFRDLLQIGAFRKPLL